MGTRRQDGKPYSKTSLISLRAGLQCRLSNDSWFVNNVIVSDLAIKQGNETLVGLFKMLSKQGLDVVRHHDPIDQHDLNLLKSSGVIGTNNPQSLQRLVSLNVALLLGGILGRGPIKSPLCT